MVGLYFALRLARCHRKRWVVGVAVAFAFAVMSHPVVALAFVLTSAGVWLGVDRTGEGFTWFLVSGLAGLVLAVVYWGPVVANHGYSPLVNAVTSRHGMGLYDLLVRALTLDISDMPFLTIWSVLAVIGVLYAVAEREWLPIALFGTLGLLPQYKFLVIPIALLAAIALKRIVDGILPLVGARPEAQIGEHRLSSLRVLVTVVFITYGFGSGLYVSRIGELVTGKPQFENLSPLVDGAEVKAMQEVNVATPVDATFVAIGHEEEWLGYYAKRTVADAMWGQEWTGSLAYEWHTGLNMCRTPECVRSIMQDAGAGWIFIPLSPAGGVPISAIQLLVGRLDEASDFERVITTPGAVVYQVQSQSSEK